MTKTRNIAWSLVLAGACLSAVASPGTLATNRLEPSIGDVFEKGMGAFGVQLNETGDGVVLQDVVLIEDDGPGVKTDSKWVTTPDDKAPLEEVGGQVWIKKVLLVEHPEASEARLYGAQGLRVRCNGHELAPQPRAKAPLVPPEWLRKGDNEFALSGPANIRVKIARRSDILDNDPSYQARPPRSFRSTDGGRTWEPIAGEYMIRLQLTQYAPTGQLISPVLDLGKFKSEDLLFQPRVKVDLVSLNAAVDRPGETSIDLAIRSGSNPVYDPSSWSGWNTNFGALPAGHRYLQWTAVLRTGNPLVTPVLKSVATKARVVTESEPPWAGQVHVGTLNNEEIRYTSIPFAYEDPRHPRLLALRQKYRLDDVVAAGRTEFEKLILLKAWVGRAWRYEPPTGKYPPWDADAILTARSGFCVQYAIVYIQCALSLGYQARYCFANNPGASKTTGHEFAEVWSNDYDKWVFMDPNQLVHHLDAKTRVPMSLLDLHNLLLKTYYGSQVAHAANGPPVAKTSPEIATCYGDQFLPVKPEPRKLDAGGQGNSYFVPTRWLNLRYLPRNNFLEQPHPLPQSQGLTWDWPDYWFFLDRQTPKDDWSHRHYTKRAADLNWTLNQVRFAVSYGDRPALVLVDMGTFTPHFDSYWRRLDGGAWGKSASNFGWNLHAGENKLEMRVSTKAGVVGPVSYIQVNYSPP